MVLEKSALPTTVHGICRASTERALKACMAIALCLRCRHSATLKADFYEGGSSKTTKQKFAKMCLVSTTRSCLGRVISGLPEGCVGVV